VVHVRLQEVLQHHALLDARCFEDVYLSTSRLQHQEQVGWKLVVHVLDHQIAGDAADVTHRHTGNQIDMMG